MSAPRAGFVSTIPTWLIALWLGAAVFFAAVVAPTAFEMFPAPAQAGALVGRLLPPLFVAGMVVAAAVLVLEMRTWRAGRVRRSAAAGVMLASCAVAQFVIPSRIADVRREAGGPVSALPRDDARRRAFGRLHAMSVAALAAAMIAALAAAPQSRGPSAVRG
jgi:Domain of unknown function (DUF4149)